MKKIAAVAAVAVMAVSAMAVSVSAVIYAPTGSASISCKSSNYSETLSYKQDTNLNSVLSIYYMYGASGSTKTDMICNYGYGEDGLWKYAIINNNNSKDPVGSSSPQSDVTVKQTTASLATSSGTTVVYSGYCASSTSSNATRYYPMSYTLTLTK